MRKSFFLFAAFFFVAAALGVATLWAQNGEFGDTPVFENDPGLRGDAAIAEQYLLWAEDVIAAGHWDEARAALERAVDFADVSSDISYLLALARLQENESRTAVLQALEQAIGTGRWRHYTEAQARLMEADQLITVRRYAAALNTLAIYRNIAGENTDYAYLRLAAMKGIAIRGVEPGVRPPALPPAVEFRRRMVETLDSYPRDTRLLHLLFDYARAREPDGDDIALMEIALRRLPFLLESDPELAWKAAPFISNDDEARRLVAAYRSGSLKPHSGSLFTPHPASLVPALNLGLVDGNGAIEELFAGNTLDKDVLVNIGRLLRSDADRDSLARRLHSFTGAIFDDEDHDGYPESRAIYRQGSLQEYYYDGNQDGITDLFISFIASTPQEAEASNPSLQGNDLIEAFVRWERYPAVRTAEMGDETYHLVPGEFRFAPIVFVELGASASYAGLMYPQRDHRSAGLTRRMLMSAAVSVQRPIHPGYGSEFKGGVETIYLDQGIPTRAEVTLNNNIVSVTEFENGYPLIQRLDMDLDGRMETVRRFNRGRLESVEHDRFGGGIFGTAEVYRADGSVVYLWDLDGNATQETKIER